MDIPEKTQDCDMQDATTTILHFAIRHQHQMGYYQSWLGSPCPLLFKEEFKFSSLVIKQRMIWNIYGTQSMARD